MIHRCRRGSVHPIAYGDIEGDRDNLELERGDLGVSAIAQQTGLERKTVRKYPAQGLEMPAYGPRKVKVRRMRDQEMRPISSITALLKVSTKTIKRVT